MRLIDADKLTEKFDCDFVNGMVGGMYVNAPTVRAIPFKDLQEILLEEQSGWIKGEDPEWDECRRIIDLIDAYFEDH